MNRKGHRTTLSRNTKYSAWQGSGVDEILRILDHRTERSLVKTGRLFLEQKDNGAVSVYGFRNENGGVFLHVAPNVLSLSRDNLTINLLDEQPSWDMLGSTTRRLLIAAISSHYCYECKFAFKIISKETSTLMLAGSTIYKQIRTGSLSPFSKHCRQSYSCGPLIDATLVAELEIALHERDDGD